MRKLFVFILSSFFRSLLWFRYRVTIKGTEHLNSKVLNQKGGVLFLPNHPTVFVDPTLVALAIWPYYSLRPIIVEYMYYTPFVHSVMKFLNAIPIPNNEVSTNSLKRKRGEKALHEVVKGLRKGENFLIYPAGLVKATAKEVVGGASGVHYIVDQNPDANIVLVRTTGLWGSSFSKALTGRSPPMFATMWQGFKKTLKNFIFFTPRRHVTIEFEPAPADFPRRADRLEFNHYLENWYNRPDGLSKTKGKFPGETLNLVSYSMWKEDLLPVDTARFTKKEKFIDLSDIPEEVHEKVLYRLAKMTERPPTEIKNNMHLSIDLGLDSIDIAELIVFLEDQFDVRGVPVNELTTVSKLIALAGKEITFIDEEEEEKVFSGWKQKIKRERLLLPEGKTIAEVFLNCCQTKGKSIACADARSGMLTFKTLKLRALLLANIIRKYPCDHVGIMLPASVAATLCIFACEIAGKVPVMLNWTVGSRHLESVMKASGVKKVLSSWAFIDRLSNVDLEPIEEELVMLEDVRREVGLSQKIKAFVFSRFKTKRLMKYYGISKKNEEDIAVLLFTSGTESLPKGVPLSHKNILCNQKDSAKSFPFYSDDILLSVLPPFHAFGFSISTLLPTLAGMKAAYVPDPTDGKKLAHGVEKYGATLICGAPTFLKNMFRAGRPEMFRSLRFAVSGAEKAPPELFALIKKNGLAGKFVEGYGITECSPVLTINSPDEPPVGVGKPVAQVELLIVHPETHEPLKQGKEGLILARGPNVFSGYLNKDLKSPFLTVEGKQWYNTGDLGYLHSNGALEISGRLKRFVKVGAEMISLGAIENALLEVAQKKKWPLAEEGPSLAICAKEEIGEKPKIVAFTVFPTTLDRLNQALREAGVSNIVRLNATMQLEEIPLMGTGKIHYRELESEFLGKALKEG